MYLKATTSINYFSISNVLNTFLYPAIILLPSGLNVTQRAGSISSTALYPLYELLNEPSKASHNCTGAFCLVVTQLKLILNKF